MSVLNNGSYLRVTLRFYGGLRFSTYLDRDEAMRLSDCLKEMKPSFHGTDYLGVFFVSLRGLQSATLHEVDGVTFGQRAWEWLKNALTSRPYSGSIYSTD